MGGNGGGFMEMAERMGERLTGFIWTQGGIDASRVLDFGRKGGDEGGGTGCGTMGVGVFLRMGLLKLL